MKKSSLFLLLLVLVSFYTCEDNKLTGSDENGLTNKSTDSVFIYNSTTTRYTNQDSIRIDGFLKGFKYIVCMNGQNTTKAIIVDSSFSIWVGLYKNSMNALILFGEDDFKRKSDPIRCFVIHDNIPPKFLESSVTQGEVSVSYNRPLQFKFDAPVSYVWATFYDRFQPDLSYTFSDSMKFVSITLSNTFTVGFEFPLRIFVKDSADNSLDTIITFRTYFDKIKLAEGSGSIGKPSFSEDGNTLFVPQTNPNCLIMIDIPTWTIKRIPTNFRISDVAFNPLNKDIYLASFEEGRIVRMNLATGEIVKSILLLRTGNVVYPSDNPVSIKFAKNGVGIVSATPYESTSPSSFQVIDSRMSDSIYVHPAFAPDVFGNFVGYSFNSNNNLVLIDVGGGSEIHIFNPLSNTFKTLHQATIRNAVGNSRNDRFVIWGDGWSLYNSSGNMISHTNPNARSNCFDFTYLPGEENRMYYINYDDKIGVFNLLDNTSVIDARVVGDCNGIVTTFDGKYIIEYQSQSLLIMEPKSFR